MEHSSHSSRRKHKRHILRDIVQVVDQHTGEPLGTVANLSEEGIMLVNRVALAAEHIYQVRLQITPGILDNAEPVFIDIGIDCLWVSPANEQAATYWSGCQIIDMSDAAADQIVRIIQKLG